MGRFVALLSWLLIAPLASCRTATLRHDQLDLREAVIDLYERQVFDNLVRVKLRKPLLMVSYGAMQGKITTKMSGSGEFTDAALDNTFGAAPGAGNITDADTNTLKVTVTLNRDVELGVKGEPVTEATVYNAFIEASIEIKDCPTAPTEKYVVMCKFDGQYYWIPESPANRSAFFDLYNKTVLRVNPARIFSNLQELFDRADSPEIKSVQ